MDGSRGHRLRVDDLHHKGFRDVVGLKLDVNRGHHMNDLLDDHHKNVTDDLMMDVNHVNRNCVLLDLMKDGNLDVNRDHHMNVMDVPNDLMMVVNRVNRNYVRRDQKMVVMKGANHDHRMSVMGDRNDLKMDGTTDVNLYRHTNGRLDDLNLDVSRVNRNYVRRDRKMDVNLDAMSHL